MQIHTHNNRRIIQHTDNHYDIEELRTDSEGVAVWAVIYCSEDEMNGYTPTIELSSRINNLLKQIPQEYRARACRECYGTDDFDFERNLTAYVLHRTWETYDHPVNEAEFVDGFCDPRTEAEKAADAFNEEYSNDATISDIRTGFQQW